MTRYALALLAGAAMLGAVPALSADLLLNNQPSMSGYVQSGGNWDGAFIGAFGGFAWDSFDVGSPDNLDTDGWLFGIDAGGNFTVTDGIVLGVVGDLAWNGVKGELNNIDGKVDWSGSLRGRVGWDADMLMPYLTGGLAFAGATLEDDDTDDTDSAMHIGWTAGVGVEVAATDQLSVDLQYRYSDYGTEAYTLNGTSRDVKLTSNQLTVGVNWKF